MVSRREEVLSKAPRWGLGFSGFSKFFWGFEVLVPLAA